MVRKPQKTSKAAKSGGKKRQQERKKAKKIPKHVEIPTITRLNMDSSFLLTIGKAQLLLDPWLCGPEIDGFELFNKAMHAAPCMDIRDLQDARKDIIVSLPFSDHCHEDTLDSLRLCNKIYATKDACKRIRKDPRLQDRQLVEIGHTHTAINNHSCCVRAIPSSGLLDFTHGGLVIEDAHHRIVYAPHGLHLAGATLTFLIEMMAGRPKDTTLMVTCSAYHVPFYLGGTVNLGLEAALALSRIVQPRRVIDIHSEQKTTPGLIPFLASTSYPTMSEIEAAFRAHLPDVQVVFLCDLKRCMLC